MHNYALQYLENQSNYSYVSACDAKAKKNKISPGATLQTKWCFNTSIGMGPTRSLSKLSRAAML